MAENELKAVSEIKFTEHYNRMWPFVKPYWIRALVGILLCIPIGALDSVVALALKPYMDLVLVDKTDRSPAYIPLLIVAFTTVQGFLNYAATYLNTWVGTKINQDLKRALFKKLLSLEIAFYDKNNSGYIMQRFSSDADMAAGQSESLYFAAVFVPFADLRPHLQLVAAVDHRHCRSGLRLAAAGFRQTAH